MASPVENPPSGVQEGDVPSERRTRRLSTVPTLRWLTDKTIEGRIEKRRASRNAYNRRKKDGQARRESAMVALARENEQLKKDLAEKDSEVRELTGIVESFTILKNEDEERFILRASKDENTGVHSFYPNKYLVDHFSALFCKVSPTGRETGVFILKEIAEDLPLLPTPPDSEDESSDSPTGKIKVFSQKIWNRTPSDGNSQAEDDTMVESLLEEYFDYDKYQASGALTPNEDTDDFFSGIIPSGQDLPEFLEGQQGRSIRTKYVSDIDMIDGFESMNILPGPVPTVQLRALEGNLLTMFPKCDDDVPGISTDYGYYGFPGSTFTLHLENRNLHSLNILLWGAPKKWVIIAPADKEKLELAILEAHRHEKGFRGARCAQWIRHELIYLRQEFLQKNSIRFVTIEQQAGDMVVISPGAYHQGFNLGQNFAQAINYAEDSSESRLAYEAKETPAACSQRPGGCQQVEKASDMNTKIDRLLNRRCRIDDDLVDKIVLSYGA